MATALLFSLSAALLLLLARRDAIADLLLPALDRFFHLDGRSLLDLATRRNMILLCHAILLVILRDAGILGAPARRRGATTGDATTFTSSAIVVADAAAPDAEGAFSAPPRPRDTNVVVWRRPGSSAKYAGADESGRRRLIRRRQPRRSPQPAAAAACQQPPLVVSKEIVLVDKATTKCDSDRRVIVADDDERDANAAAAEETPELADDRRIQEFIDMQWSKIRQESLQLVVRVPASANNIDRCDTET